MLRQQITNNQPQINKAIKQESKNKEELLQKKFVESIKSTNTNQIQECLTYLEDLPLEVIELVLEKTAGIKGRWSYAKTVLDDWIKRGVDCWLICWLLVHY